MYCFVATYQEAKDAEHKLMASLVVGYIICNVAYMIPFSISEVVDNVGITISSIIVGYFAGKISNSKFLLTAMEKLKIRRTTNSYLWNDLMDKDFPMKAKIKIDNIIYCGKVHLIEEFSNHPLIVLADYSVNGVLDENNNKVIVLDTAKASEIIIEYDELSEMKEFIKFE